MPFVASHFAAPKSGAFPGYLLRVLGPAFADQDFSAVTASSEVIRNVFGPENDWPSKEITFEENKADLYRHEREFNEGKAFAYSLLDHKEERYFGCLYLKPIKSKTGLDQRHTRFDAQAYLWLSVLQQDLDETLVQAQLSAWFASDWNLPRVAWPGHDPNWNEWKSLSLLPASAA